MVHQSSIEPHLPSLITCAYSVCVNYMWEVLGGKRPRIFHYMMCSMTCMFFSWCGFALLCGYGIVRLLNVTIRCSMTVMAHINHQHIINMYGAYALVGGEGLCMRLYTGHVCPAMPVSCPDPMHAELTGYCSVCIAEELHNLPQHCVTREKQLLLGDWAYLY